MSRNKPYRILLVIWYGAVLVLLLSMPIAALGSEYAKSVVLQAHKFLHDYEVITKIIVIAALVFYALEHFIFIIKEKSFTILFDSRRISSDYAIEIFFPLMALFLFT